MNIQNLVPLSELDAKAPEDTEEAIALEFAERHGKHLRYVAAWGRWMVYDAGRWAKDDTVDVFDKARHLCRAKSAALEHFPIILVHILSLVRRSWRHSVGVKSSDDLGDGIRIRHRRFERRPF